MPINLTGQRFGLLTVKDTSEVRPNGKRYWACKCDCGRIKYVYYHNLIQGNVRSCGCKRRGLPPITQTKLADFPRLSENSPKHISEERRLQLKRKMKERYSHIVSRAKHRHIFCDISFEVFAALMKKPCLYCGRLKVTGLDRKNSNVGYTLENCVSCCKNCNYAKNNLSVGAFANLIRIIYERLQEQQWDRIV
jgi:hypothetical protein